MELQTNYSGLTVEGNLTRKNNTVKHIYFKLPKFKSSILISYEGKDVGSIYLSDVSDDKDMYNIPLKHGSFAVMDCVEQVNNSLHNGVIKYFSDINSSDWNSNPPIVVYRLKHFI